MGKQVQRGRDCPRAGLLCPWLCLSQLYPLCPSHLGFLGSPCVRYWGQAARGRLGEPLCPFRHQPSVAFSTKALTSSRSQGCCLPIYRTDQENSTIASNTEYKSCSPPWFQSRFNSLDIAFLHLVSLLSVDTPGKRGEWALPLTELLLCAQALDPHPPTWWCLIHTTLRSVLLSRVLL